MITEEGKQQVREIMEKLLAAPDCEVTVLSGVTAGEKPESTALCVSGTPKPERRKLSVTYRSRPEDTVDTVTVIMDPDVLKGHGGNTLYVYKFSKDNPSDVDAWRFQAPFELAWD
jgi:hypothetical protein